MLVLNEMVEEGINSLLTASSGGRFFVGGGLLRGGISCHVLGEEF